MIFVGITGSIGCGKTTLSDILREQGYLVYDIDKWVKYIYYDGKFLEIIKNKFPEVFENGIFNKRKLRELVFNNISKLKVLEGLIHPFLKNRLRKIIRTSKNVGFVFVDVALLFEMGWDRYFDIILLADVDKDIQRKRVMKRDRITSEEFDRINEIQMPMTEKRTKVDFIINTGVDKIKLKKRIFDFLESIKNYE